MRYKQNKGCLIFCKGEINQNKGCLIFCKGDLTKTKVA